MGRRASTGTCETLETLLCPDLFIIGGGVSKKSEKFFGYIDTRAPSSSRRSC